MMTTEAIWYYSTLGVLFLSAVLLPIYFRGRVFRVSRSKQVVIRAGLYAVAMTGVLIVYYVPSQIAQYGFPAGYMALAVIAVAIVGAVFSRRLYVQSLYMQPQSLADVFRQYFGGRLVPGIASGVASFFVLTLVTLAFQQVVAGVSYLGLYSHGLVPYLCGIVFLVTAFIHSASDNAVARQVFGAVSFAIVVIAVFSAAWEILKWVGGSDALMTAVTDAALGDEGARWGTTEGRGGGDFSTFFALSGIASWSSDPGLGGQWTGTMVLSGIVVFLGLAVSPAGFAWMASRGQRSISGSSYVFVFSIVAGATAVIAAPILGMAKAVDILPTIPNAFSSPNRDGTLAAGLIGIAAICCLHALVAALLRGLRIDGNDRSSENRRARGIDIRLIVLLLSGVLAVLISPRIATFWMILGLALSVQMLPALIAVCWAPWLSRPGVSAGMVCGIVVTVCTDIVGVTAMAALLDTAPWGPYPGAVHSAGWGLAANLVVAVAVSAMTQSADSRGRRHAYHDLYTKHAPIPESARGLVPAAWIFTVTWLLFAVGPGAVVGNTIFGRPDAGIQGWNFGIPSIWAWQIAAWGFGVFLVWFLGTRLHLAKPPVGKIEEGGGADNR